MLSEVINLSIEVEGHYGLLLGLHPPWDVSSVDLKIDEHRVDVIIEYGGDEGAYPVCGVICLKHDDRNPKTWWHLDTLQLSTYVHCLLPASAAKYKSRRVLTHLGRERIIVSHRFLKPFLCAY